MRTLHGGIAQALALAKEATAESDVCAILGDNVFLDDLSGAVQNFTSGAHLFLQEVPDPERFGVVEMAEGQVVSIEEKPAKPKSNLIQTGCYLYDARYSEAIAGLTPSARGELEITDVNTWYLERGELSATVLEHEWIDAGTFDSLLHAANVVAKRAEVEVVQQQVSERLITQKAMGEKREARSESVQFESTTIGL